MNIKINPISMLMFFLWCFPGMARASDYKLRAYQEFELKNGLHVIAIEDKTLPRIGLGLMFKVGSLYDPADKKGLNNLTSTLLEFGTKTKTATKLADEFGQIASDIQISAGSDFTSVSASTLSTQKEKLLQIFSEVTMSPAFSKNEIERQRSQVLSALAKISDNPSSYADILLDKENFGQHPYANSIGGEIKTVKTISQEDILKHYSSYYRPNNATLYVTGAFDVSFIDKVKKIFSKWTQKNIPPRMENLSSAYNKVGTVLYSKPGLQQSQIRFAQRGIKRSDSDYLLLRVANVILGSDFASRLNMRVRDDLGLTYSIQSIIDAKLDVGSFEISTFTRNDKVVETVQETSAIYKNFVEKGITQKELDAAKALMIGQFPASIETTEKLAYNLMILRGYGVNDSYLHHFEENLQKITLENVNAAIKKHMHPEELRTVIYADKEQVLNKLKTMGPIRVVVVELEK